MKILDHLASLVWLVAIAAVVLALLYPAADGQSELCSPRADAKQEAVVECAERSTRPVQLSCGLRVSHAQTLKGWFRDALAGKGK